MLATQALQPQLRELQRVYGNDREKYAQAQMELYRKNGVSMAGGCLPSLIQLILIWPMYRVVSGPLTYIMGVASENLQKIVTLLQEHHMVGALPGVENFNLPVIQALHDNPSVLSQAVNQGLIQAKDVMDLNFLGLNLGLTPTISPALLFGPDRAQWLPLLIIPILTLITAYIPLWLNDKMNPLMAMNREKERLAKHNPARNAQGKERSQMDQMNGMMKTMPLISLIFSFMMPAGMGLYIIAGSLIYIASSAVTYYLYNKPYYELVKAHEEGRLTDAEVERMNQDLSPRELRKQQKREERAKRQQELTERLAQAKANKR